MENNYSNYDMLDKLIANNKKAKSWTVFWVIILSVMAAAVLYLAHTVSDKNRTITAQEVVIQSSQEILELKSRIIDSLTENCNDAKTEIINDYDSVISHTQKAFNIVNKPAKLTTYQKDQLKNVNSSIEKIQTSIKSTKAEIIDEDTRLFVQYNDSRHKDKITGFLGLLNGKLEYVVAPAEYIDKNFSTILKFYNYQNEKEELFLKTMLMRHFRIPDDKILIKHEINPKIRKTVEIWIGTRPISIRPIQLKKNN